MNTSELSRCEYARQTQPLPRAARRRIARVYANMPPMSDQHATARALKAEWETFLASTGFAMSEDAMSKETVTLEEAGFEEEDTRAVFGLFPEGVSSGVRAVCDAVYEEDSAEHMVG